MQANFALAGYSQNLACASKNVTNEVISVELVSWDGPTECIRGETIAVNITASYTFNTDRYGKFEHKSSQNMLSLL